MDGSYEKGRGASANADRAASLTASAVPASQSGIPSAFPVSTIDGVTNEGMTLRDWFAGQALPGYVQHLGSQNIHAGNYIEECAREAYAFADAMIAAREGGAA